MKKGILILIGMFLMVSTIEANNGKERLKFRVNHSYNNAIRFIELGIEFHVFTNGDYDFDTSIKNRRTRIKRDYKGRITRVGNVSLRYDFRGNITRIGNIPIKYFRNRVTNVGDLKVRYNRWGTPFFYGNVRNYYYDNGIRYNINFGDICNYNDSYFYDNDFRRNYSLIREDRNFYYYKSRLNSKVGKRSNIIRRKKYSNTIENSRKIRKNNTFSNRRESKNRKN